MKKAMVNHIFKTLAEANPQPVTELYSVNDYTLLVAIILSAQSTDAGVNKATPALFDVADTPEAMLELGEAELKIYIKTIGLLNSKAKNIITMSQQLIGDFAGDIPEDRDALQTLAGVGRKTANVWLNCARGHPTMAVDTHVQRVSNRIGLCNTSNPLQTEKALLDIIADKWMLHAHHWLILHGRYICKARKPECGQCNIEQWCAFKDKRLLVASPFLK